MPVAKRNGRVNFLKAASNVLPRGSKPLSHLVDDEGDRIENSADIAAKLKATWEPIWSRDDPDGTILTDYLNKYTKRIRRPVKDMTLQLGPMVSPSRSTGSWSILQPHFSTTMQPP